MTANRTFATNAAFQDATTLRISTFPAPSFPRTRESSSDDAIRNDLEWQDLAISLGF